MKLFLGVVVVFLVCPFVQGQIIVNHSCTDIKAIPKQWIEQAKTDLHIAYGHTSHGSQLTEGMWGMVDFMNGLGYEEDLYAVNEGGTDGALDIDDYAMDGDVGYYPDWVNNTRAYLQDPAHSDVNVVIWSWCGQVSWYNQQYMIDRYLKPMSDLEKDYPNITFVYMTGHLDGTGVQGNLHQRNQQIRQYCQANNKVLYDFADIESYDPDGKYYLDKSADDGCNYDSDGNGSLDSNWAIEWQNSHTKNVDWYDCGAAHTEPLNANRKAYAAWWLWARLAGWDGAEGEGEGEAEGEGEGEGEGEWPGCNAVVQSLSPGGPGSHGGGDMLMIAAIAALFVLAQHMRPRHVPIRIRVDKPRDRRHS